MVFYQRKLFQQLPLIKTHQICREKNQKIGVWLWTLAILPGIYTPRQPPPNQNSRRSESSDLGYDGCAPWAPTKSRLETGFSCRLGRAALSLIDVPLRVSLNYPAWIFAERNPFECNRCGGSRGIGHTEAHSLCRKKIWLLMWTQIS